MDHVILSTMFNYINEKIFEKLLKYVKIIAKQYYEFKKYLVLAKKYNKCEGLEYVRMREFCNYIRIFGDDNLRNIVQWQFKWKIFDKDKEIDRIKAWNILIVNQTEEICIEAVKKDGYALK